MSPPAELPSLRLFGLTETGSDFLGGSRFARWLRKMTGRAGGRQRTVVAHTSNHPMTEMPFDEPIPLDRTFHELTLSDGESDDSDLRYLTATRREALNWSDLFEHPRVVLLSEAGAGKTTEIREAARRLRREGKPAFFIRLEHVADGLDRSFEEGTIAEFDAWSAAGVTGWLFLDSIDEARLKDPKDFERALRLVSRRVGPVLQQVRVLITGRTHAWRAKTDLLLCNALLPCRERKESNQGGGLIDDGNSSQKASQSGTNGPSFKVLTLDDLHGAQIDAFLQARGIHDAAAFKAAVERRDVAFLTARPIDLSELIDFWRTHGRIGSRLELTRDSIARRLEERDQDRAEARPIAADKLRTGAQLVAAAMTLGQQALVRVPDGSENSAGMPIRELLGDWNETEMATLLSRPIFDEGIYGTVRFHHRSVREYLTAEWLGSLLERAAARRQIANLFFKSQYGIDVIVPAMRPVLPWLALLDDGILAHVRRLEPELLFEGGDPSQLPYETRRDILRDVCERWSEPNDRHSVADVPTLRLLASDDMSSDVLALFGQYRDDEELASLLLRIVWQGQLRSCAQEVKRIAIQSRNKFTRVSALRALSAVGGAPDREDVRRAILAEGDELDRDYLAELLRTLPGDDGALAWLFTALEKAAPKRRFSVDHLSNELSLLIADWPISTVSKLVDGLAMLLGRPPFIEARHCETSARYCWLAQAAADAVVRLIEARAPAALDVSAKFLLRQLPLADDYREYSFGNIRDDLPKQVAEWPELNRSLFWYDVARKRAELESAKGESLTEVWRVAPLGRYWSFSKSAFDLVCDDIRSQALMDDRLIAITLAFTIYTQNGRPRSWRRTLHQLARNEPRLLSTLQGLMHPLPAAQPWRKAQTHWRRQAAREAATQKKNEERWRTSLAKNLDTLRNSGRPDGVTNAQWYLLNEMRDDADRSGKWSDGDWRSLIARFGEPVAHAFRDGAVAFWRTHRARLRSDGVEANSTPATAIFGLVGLAIEASEEPAWPTHLSADEATLAARFALHELNGFPSWLSALYAEHPQSVADVVLGEIDYELSHDDVAHDSHYVLDDVGWSGDWMWDRLAGALVWRLKTPPRNLNTLGSMIGIIQGSSLGGEIVASLAAERAKSTKELSTGPMWFAMWAGVDPAEAIPSLAAKLEELASDVAQVEFAMRFITALIGGRRERATVRQAFRTVEHLRDLYLLVSKYIRESEDVHRFNSGVYSPGLRDDAQDARNALLSFIAEKQGKEAFSALVDISRARPTESSALRLALRAKEKAALDANGPAWSPVQVRDFHDRLECTPSNHRDLWTMAVDRLLDLKHDLEDGDASVAGTLLKIDAETEMRTFIGNWCRDHSNARYSIPQEEELADARRPDLRFHGVGFDNPVPIELKIADKWTGPKLFERLENQLCGDYLRDVRSNRGVFCLVYRGHRRSWGLPGGGRADSFDALVEALRQHWLLITPRYSGVEEIGVVGIDLTMRSRHRRPKRRTRGHDGEQSA